MKDVANQSCTTCTAYTKSVFYKSELAEKLLPESKKQFRLRNGEYLFKEGEYATGVYCVNQGRLFVFKKDENGMQHVLTDATEGELLGISAVTDSVPFGTSARAAGDVEVCFIPKNVFVQLIAVCP
ncbi:MAG: Crp/Fnr family transcriptional regulator, partial [Bacteroidia bacterium]